MSWYFELLILILMILLLFAWTRAVRRIKFPFKDEKEDSEKIIK